MSSRSRRPSHPGRQFSEPPSSRPNSIAQNPRVTQRIPPRLDASLDTGTLSGPAPTRNRTVFMGVEGEPPDAKAQRTGPPRTS
jgi:hypothetical protein